MYLTQDDFEDRLNQARQRGANEDQVAQLRVKYQGSVKPKDNLIVGAAKAIAKPAVDFGRDVAGGTYAANAAAAEILGRLTVDPQNKNKRFDREIQRGLSFMTPRGKDAALDESAIPTKQVELGLQRGAGAGSYLVPGGSTLKAAAGMGAASGALYGASQGDRIDPNKIAGGAAGGAIGGAMLPTAGAVFNKTKGILGKTGETLQERAVVSALGKPIKSEGGAKLVKQIQEVGLDSRSPEALAKSADELLAVEGPKVGNAARELTVRGVKIPRSRILADLEEELIDAKSEVTKAPLRKVIDILKTDLGDGDEITPELVYALKQEYGPLGKWTSASSKEEQTIANAWEKVYKQLNEVLDTSFKKNGFDEFRAINDKVAAAVKAKNFADRKLNTPINGSSFGLLDTIAGVGGFASGGPTGAAGTVLGKRALMSPTLQRNTGKVLSGLDNVSASPLMGNAAQIPPRVVGQTAGTLVSGGQDSNTYNSPAYETGNNGEQHSGNINPTTPQVNRDRPIMPGQAALLASQGVSLNEYWVVSPEGDKIWNPISKRFIPFNPDVWETGAVEPPTRDAANAMSGVEAIKTAQSLLFTPDGEVNRGTLGRSMLPGGAFSGDAQVLKRATDEMQDVLQRLRTGAAINDAEYDFYNRQIPKLSDTPEAIRYKLQVLNRLFSSISGPQMGDMQ